MENLKVNWFMKTCTQNDCKNIFYVNLTHTCFKVVQTAMTSICRKCFLLFKTTFRWLANFSKVSWLRKAKSEVDYIYLSYRFYLFIKELRKEGNQISRIFQISNLPTGWLKQICLCLSGHLTQSSVQGGGNGPYAH